MSGLSVRQVKQITEISSIAANIAIIFYMMAGSMKQESRGFSHVRFKDGG